MSTLDNLKAQAEAIVAETDWDDFADRFSAVSYLMAYNDSVPPEYQVDYPQPEPPGGAS